jgi:subtilase family serine protease
MQRIRRVLPPFFITVLLSFSLSAFAQTPTPRLTGNFPETGRAALVGSRTPQASRGQDLGPVSPQMSIPGITLVFKRSPEQESALQQLLSAQQNPSSPLYHQWLTPDTFASRFGMADEDITAAETWLQSQGFQIEGTARSRDRITFSGTALQVQSAFGTDLHYYQVDGERHFAPAADLTLPTELASVTAAVLHLSNFRPKPSVKVISGPKPDYTDPATGVHYLIPSDIATIYDLTPLDQAASNGSGQALAVVGQSFVDTSGSSKVGTFQVYTGREDPVSAVLVPGSGVQAISPGDEGESEIDLEYSSGIAPSANIFLVYVGANQNYDVFDALAFAIDQKIAPVVSISYGVCESLMSSTDLDQGNALFEQASAQGQSIVAAAGDSGSTACAGYTTSDGVSLAMQQALSVSYPASSSYVTAVGGTQMAAGTFNVGSSPYWGTPVPVAGTEGLILSYVPEVVWNEGSATFGLAAGGGGTSAHFTRPTWQSGVPGIPSGTFRLLPDIALQSSIKSPGFLICSSDPTLTQGQTSCSDALEDSSGKYTVAGGTSFAAPIFAGFLAILNQLEQTNGQGNVNPQLYALASNSASYAATFHDITSGSNACISGTGNCAAPGESGYAATPGYDEATGLGSVDFGQLVKAWPSSSTAKLAPTFILFQTYQTSIAVGASDQIPITVGPINQGVGSSIPTGTVLVSLDGTVVGAPLAISPTEAALQAGATLSFVAPSTAGSHLISVTYSGDTTHSSSTATYSVLVGDVTATGSFTVAAGNLTVANGSQGSTQISAIPAGGYTGRVSWSLSAAPTNGSAELCYFIGAPTTNNPNAATLTIGVGSACNSVSPADHANLRPLITVASIKKENPSPWRKTPTIAVYAGLLLGSSLFTRKRKLSKSLWLAIVLLLTGATLSLSGCGGGSSGSASGLPNTTPSASTYTLQLIGTDSVNTSITASTTFTLTVP